MNKMKTLATIFLIGAISATGLKAQETSKVNLQSNFNSIEASANIPSMQPHMRSVNSVGVNLGKVSLTYNGLNEADLTDLTTYYGEHTPTIRVSKIPVEATSKIETTVDGVDVKYGVNIPIPDLTGLYGNLNLTANKNGADIVAFIGKDFKDGKYLIELYNKTMISQDEINNYAEIQAAIRVTKNTYIMGRASFDNDKILQGNIGVNFQF